MPKHWTLDAGAHHVCTSPVKRTWEDEDGECHIEGQGDQNKEGGPQGAQKVANDRGDDGSKREHCEDEAKNDRARFLQPVNWFQGTATWQESNLVTAFDITDMVRQPRWGNACSTATGRGSDDRSWEGRPSTHVRSHKQVVCWLSVSNN